MRTALSWLYVILCISAPLYGGELKEFLVSQEGQGFVNNVLGVVPPSSLHGGQSWISNFLGFVAPQTIDETVRSIAARSDAVVYTELQKRRDEFLSRWTFWAQYRALQKQRALIAQQSQQLLAETPTPHTYIEIGTSGTYVASTASALGITGERYVMTDSPSALQSIGYSPFNGFKSYDEAIPLQEYDPVDTAFQEGSVDLVACFAGLHHAPPEKLDEFVESLYRIVKPGGYLLLREHDVRDEHMRHVASAAHTVFNMLIPRISYEQDQQEVRNFNSHTYWIDLLERHGFRRYTTSALYQEGDPTKNGLLCFYKPPQNMHEMSVAAPRDHAHETPEYTRSTVNSAMAVPEWYNVAVAQEYGHYLEHTPFYSFPYMKSLGTYWYLFARSYLAAAKHNGYLSTACSPYTLANIFIGWTMTMEHCAKSFISAPIRFMYADTEPEAVEAFAQDPHEELAKLSSDEIAIEKKYKHNVARIALPRYVAFKSAIEYLKNNTQGVTLTEIAGQNRITMQIRYAPSTYTNEHVREKVAEWGGTFEYSWSPATDDTVAYAVIDVPVRALLHVMRNINDTPDMHVAHLFDY